MPASGAAAVAAGREYVERATELLAGTTPAALNRSTGLLEAAVSELRSVKVAAGDPAARDEARRLAASVHLAQARLRKTAEYHGGWIRWLHTRTGGYGRNGEPAGVEFPPALAVAG